ncbi:MAG: WbqC family protein [Bacteroidetes bacterium]|nr:WbqC family protein [Bacteroidota bacterium]
MNHSKVILPVAYLPPVEYFTWLMSADEVVLEIQENYVKQTYRNRCYICGANGRLMLSIPVIKNTGNHTLLKDIVISYRLPWQQIHWRAITSAYSSSPYFLYYKDELQPFYENQIKFLLDFNLKLFDIILSYLGIPEKYSLTERYIHDPLAAMDQRTRLNPRHKPTLEFPPYTQVFHYKAGFIPNLSIIDLLFNMGPDSKKYLCQLLK